MAYVKTKIIMCLLQSLLKGSLGNKSKVDMMSEFGMSKRSREKIMKETPFEFS